jgi:cysteinyl-tRNA synthetase
MYVCGVTVYDDCHVGHGRVYVTFDVIRRFLEYEGYDVKYVVNFTDVDDKIIDRADELGTTPRELSQKYTKAYFEVMDRLNVRRADVHPTVTGHIEEIKDFVEDLLEKNMAYEVDGDVYFDVGKFDEYGKLSGQDPDEMDAGSRVDVDERKKSPLDFALWKNSEEGEPSWESPWGEGRPGWHIECSVMSSEHLNEENLNASMDIHGGGRDLIFPHHENEIAQSEARTGKQFSRYWMHNGFVTIDDEKMSKSEGNFYTLKEIFDDFDPRVVRYFYLTRQYRSPLNFSFDRLKESRKALNRLEDFLVRLKEAESWSSGRDEPLGPESIPDTEQERESFLDYMRSDFNTAAAIGHLQDWAKDWNPILDEWEKHDSLHQIEHHEITKARNWLETAMFDILGLKAPSDETIDLQSDGSVEPFVEKLVQLRQQARENEDYDMADRIRESLEELGYRIEDRPKGTVWEPIRDQ